MPYIKMSKAECRQATYVWLNEQSLESLASQITHWLRYNPKKRNSYNEWVAMTYPEQTIAQDLDSQIEQIIEWLNDCEYQVEDFEEWYVDYLERYGDEYEG